tara:strand:- start:802 stop:1140 length:339 start_codon:yes stop_codon:yes gene_type:complete
MSAPRASCARQSSYACEAYSGRHVRTGSYPDVVLGLGGHAHDQRGAIGILDPQEVATGRAGHPDDALRVRWLREIGKHRLDAPATTHAAAAGSGHGDTHRPELGGGMTTDQS